MQGVLTSNPVTGVGAREGTFLIIDLILLRGEGGFSLRLERQSH